MDWIGGVLLTFFLLLGVLFGFRQALHWLLDRPVENVIWMPVFFQGHVEDAEMQLRQAVHRLHMWQGTKVLLCIDGGMDEETRRVCELFTQDFPVCRVVTPEEVADMCRCAESNCNPVENRVY